MQKIKKEKNFGSRETQLFLKIKKCNIYIFNFLLKKITRKTKITL